MFSIGSIRSAAAAELTDQIAHRLPQQSSSYVPAWPCGVLDYIRSRPDLSLTATDLVDALHVIVQLRLWLNFLEWANMIRGRRWSRITRDLSQVSMGHVLGISGSGFAKRLVYLREAALGHRQVKISPRYARISIADVRQAAQRIVDLRVDRSALDHPDPDDFFGVASYVIEVEQRERDALPLWALPDDVTDCLRVVAFLRRYLEDLEGHYLARGRLMQIPDRVLGVPFGRLAPHATWQARRRIANGQQPGGERVVSTATKPADPNIDGDATPAWAVPQIREAVSALLGYRSQLAHDVELDEWLQWLDERCLTQPQTSIRRVDRGLLWSTCDEILSSELAQPVDGLLPLVKEVLELLRKLR